jgi:hypothetical protein
MTSARRASETLAAAELRRASTAAAGSGESPARSGSRSKCRRGRPLRNRRVCCHS